MKKLILVLVLMYFNTKTNGQGIFNVRVVELQTAYGISQLLPHNLHFGKSVFWDKPLGWASGFRMTTNFASFNMDTQVTSNQFERAYSWYTGLDYQLNDDYSAHKLVAHASFGMAYYLKHLTMTNIITEPNEIAVLSPHLRLAARYQHQFGVIGLYAQPWMLIGTQQEIGADIGIILRRAYW